MFRLTLMKDINRMDTSTNETSNEEKKMFEVELKDMNASVFIEDGLYNILTASNVGVNPDLVSKGFRKYSFNDALVLIKALDKALVSCPKYAFKRIRACRGSVINAFGPEMIDYLSHNNN